MFEFLHQRLLNLLEEESVDNDISQAIAGETISIIRLLSNPVDVKFRAKLLMDMRESGELLLLQSVIIRASKLAAKGQLPLDITNPDSVIDKSKFESESEYLMFDVLKKLEPFAKPNNPECYKNLIRGFIESTSILSEFFDGSNSVMVMAEDKKIRNNRLNLLGLLRNQSRVLADFNKIIS